MDIDGDTLYYLSQKAKTFSIDSISIDGTGAHSTGFNWFNASLDRLKVDRKNGSCSMHSCMCEDQANEFIADVAIVRVYWPGSGHHRVGLHGGDGNATKITSKKNIAIGWTLDRKRNRVVYMKSMEGIASMDYNGNDLKVVTVPFSSHICL